MIGEKYIRKSGKKIWLKWNLAFKIVPIVAVVALLKFLAHYYEFEVMELNALFSSLVAGTIFLIGFLIAGVLSDYKESEKIPSELVATLKTLLDDGYTIYKGKDSQSALNFIVYQKELAGMFKEWFYKNERTSVVLKKISDMNDFFVQFDKEGVTPNYIIKMKVEQNALRKLILRIDTIRDTDFIGTGYAIVEAMGFVIASGLVIIHIEPFYASLFFAVFLTFLISYMFLLIKDLDNPFDYSVYGDIGTEISLKPLNDHIKSLDDFG
jgi:hypothetical protein